ncbi:uncharacterized protein LOC111412064 [Olea europaea var. sylvestris]|uniref:uncharacterized protein LOC111412064 n=1 Tax=Olea europaea var. sylvestris TaxID=158386 RepID=UPI000C1D2B1A|nr:uncharacterized protein LOC111412064 [Olea europaea var. sylvestris]
MEEHFEEVIKQEWYKEDFKTIMSQINEQENLLRLKRRWLMDLPSSKREQQQIEELLPPSDKILPESLLREDEVCYENIKTFVEKGFGVRKCEMEHQLAQEDIQNFDLYNDTKSKSYRSAAIKVLDGLEEMPFRTLSAMHRKLRGVRYSPTMQPPKSGWGRDRLISVVRERCMKMLLELDEGDETPEPLASALAVSGLTLKLIHNSPSVIDFRKFSPETEALQNDIVKAIWLLNDVKRVSLIELKKLQFLLDPSTELSDRSFRMAVRNLLTDYLFECSDMDNVPDCLLETLSIINRRSQLPSRRKHVSSKVHSSSHELMKEEIENEVECILTASAQAKQIVWDFLSEHRLDQDFADAYMEGFEQSEMTTSSDDDSEEELNLPQLYRFGSHNPDDQMESIGEINPVGRNSPASTSESDNCSPLLSPNESLNVTLEPIHINGVESVESLRLVHSTSCLESKMSGDMQNMDRNQHPSGSTGDLRMACSNMPLTAKKNVSTLPISPDKNSSWNDVESQEISINSAEIPKYEFSENFSGVNNQSKKVNQYLEVQDACDKTIMVAYDLIGCILDEYSKIEDRELYQGDKSYLRNRVSVPQYSEVSRKQMASSKDDILGSTIVQAIDELIPSFPESGKEKLMKLVRMI